MHPLGDHPQRLAHPVGRLALAPLNRDAFELRPIRHGHEASDLLDHPHMPADDAPVLPRGHRHRVVLNQVPRFVDPPLQRPVGRDEHPGEFSRDAPQRHLARLDLLRCPGRLFLREHPGRGEHPNLTHLTSPNDVRRPLRIRDQLSEGIDITVATHPAAEPIMRMHVRILSRTSDIAPRLSTGSAVLIAAGARPPVSAA
ncbi:hypothetical protein ABIC53_000069 [Microbacterium sp. 1262]